MSLVVGGVKEVGNIWPRLEAHKRLWYVGFPPAGASILVEKTMLQTRAGLLVCTAIAVSMIVSACGGGAAKEDQAVVEEWAWLTETKQQLDSKRQELVDLEAEAAAAAEMPEEGEAAATEEGTEVAAAIDYEAQIEALSGEIEGLSEEFGTRLVGFLNADPMIEGEPPTERQMNALRMKSAEDIILAEEWIDKGGDYKRALDILTTALMFDPDNPELQAAIAEAETDRYMTPEKFALAEKGMSEADVRAALGQVNLHNVREYPEKDVVAWFYPTAEDGSAAAVWFQPNKTSGALEVYQVKFEAIKPGEVAEEG